MSRRRKAQKLSEDTVFEFIDCGYNMPANIDLYDLSYLVCYRGDIKKYYEYSTLDDVNWRSCIKDFVLDYGEEDCILWRGGKWLNGKSDNYRSKIVGSHYYGDDNGGPETLRHFKYNCCEDHDSPVDYLEEYMDGRYCSKIPISDIPHTVSVIEIEKIAHSSLASCASVVLIDKNKKHIPAPDWVPAKMGALDKDKEVHKIKSSYHLIRVDKLNGRRNFPFIPDFYQCLMFAGKKMFGDILPLGGFTRLDVATKSLKYYRIYGFDQVNTIQQIKTADVEWARIPCRGEFSLFYNYGVWYSFRNE